MCLTALKNSLVLGNCQPIISTPSSGLCLALHLPVSLSLCLRAHLSASLSMYLIFSPNSPSKHSFSVTNTLSQIPSLYIFILPIPYPWTRNQHFFQPFTKSLCHRVVYLCFTAFPPFHYSSSTPPSCKTALDAPY